MADINDFLQKLGIKNTIPQYKDSPMDTEATEDSPIKNPEAYMPAEADNSDDLPATEEITPAASSGVFGSNTDKAREAMAQFSRSPAEENAAPANIPTEAIPQPVGKASQYQQILNAWKSLPQAQEQYQKSLGNLAMVHGANQIAQAMASGYGGKTASDEETMKLLKEQAYQPINAIKNTMDQGGETLGLQAKIEEQDPNSQKSQSFRKLVEATLPKIKTAYGNNWNLITAADAPDIMNLGKMQETLAERLQAQTLAHEQKNEKRTQDVALKIDSQMESQRSQNPMLKQAYNDVYASSKANELADKFKNMSPEMFNLYSQEIGKLATGGSPSIHELQGLDPGTYTKQFASFLQKIGNKPSPADVQEFVKQYQQYGGYLQNNAKDVIRNHINENINMYKELGMITPQEAETMRAHKLAKAGLSAGAGQASFMNNDVITVKGPSGQTVQMKKEIFDAKYKGREGYSMVGQ